MALVADIQNHLFLRLELEIIKCLASSLALKSVFHSYQHCISLYVHMSQFDIQLVRSSRYYMSTS